MTTWEPGEQRRARSDQRTDLEVTVERRAWRTIFVIALVVVVVGGGLFALFAANLLD